MTQEPERPPTYDEIEDAEVGAAVAFKNAAGKLWADSRKGVGPDIEKVLALRGLLDAWLKALSDKKELRLAREAYAAKTGGKR